MDYLGWELERQRAALAALLWGGGEARDGETVREGERRSPERPGAALGSAEGLGGRYAGELAGRYVGGTAGGYAGGTAGGYAGGTAGGYAGGTAGRYAGGRSGDAGVPGYIGGLADESLGAWETVRMARTDRLPERMTEPVSAWEEIAGVGGTPEQADREKEAGASGRPGQAFRQRERRPLSGETDVQLELLRPSGGYEAEGRRTAAGDTAETAAAWAAGKKRGGERPARKRSGGGETPETGTGSGETAGDPGVRAVRRSADAGGFTRQWSGLRRSVEEDAPAAPLWGGVRETAALRAEDGARALSRAVQRDARRYDGGFYIY